MPKPTMDMSACGKLPKTARRFVLQSIACYLPDDWIAQALKARYNLVRTPNAIRQYRYGKAYQAEIAEYRRQYEKTDHPSPLESRQYLLDCLHASLDEALLDRDYRAVVALIRQACKLTGITYHTTLETSNSTSSYESALQDTFKNMP